MADMNKAEKLAAARKKLKEYQQKGKDSQPTITKSSGKKIVPKLQVQGKEKCFEQNSVFDSGPIHPNNDEIQVDTRSDAELPSTVESSLETKEGLDVCQAFARFDTYHGMAQDSVSDSRMELDSSSGDMTKSDRQTYDIFNSVNLVNSVPTNTMSTFSSLKMSGNVAPHQMHSFDIVAARDFFDNIPSGTQVTYATDLNTASHAEKEESVRVDNQLFEGNKVLLPCDEHESVVNTSQISPFSLESDNSQIIENETNCSVLENQSDGLGPQEHPDTIISSLSPEKPIVNSKSSTESLRQLSLQMNGLIEDGNQGKTVHTEDSELECRNQELAGLLAGEKQRSEQLELQLKEYQLRIRQLQVELDQLRTESDARVTREIGPVQEQLQLHVQTVGILVGEKTELQAALTKSQNVAKQKAGEAEELQGRLKASRHRVMDLEKEVSLLQETSDKFEKLTHDLTSELDKLKQEHNISQKQLLEREEEVSELQQKLNTKINDCISLQEDLQEKSSQLSLTQLRVQQLSTTDTSEMDGQVEQLHQQKIFLEKQVTELQQSVKLVGSERDQASQQYQQYVLQLNGQLQNLASKINSLTSENEQLVTREQSLVRHVAELEKQLQQQQNQKRRDSSPKLLHQESPTFQEFETKLKNVENEKEMLEEQLHIQKEENRDIQMDLIEEKKKVEELESMLERMEGEQPDKTKLLAAMESDKVAAARAVGQNQRLKQQLEELQEGFVKMSNSKLELTEQLQHEQHICKEQGERLAQQEEEVNDLRFQLLQKEQLLQQNSSELSNQMLQHSQIADRMRHYEAHDKLNDLLQQELEQAKDRLQALSAQNNELRTLLAQQSAHDSGSSSGAGSLDEALSRKDEMLATLSASVRQLELERDQLLEQLKHQGIEQKALQQIPSEDNNNSSPNSFGTEHPKDSESMKIAMEKLEERFTRTMKEVADLSDEKQRLEHLVLQLQGETETIGEYIALYQVQRGILRQRAKEKDEQLSKLSKDREEMKNKLGELNELIKKLVLEKEAIRKISHNIPIEHTGLQVSSNISPLTEGTPNGEIVECEKAIEMNGDTEISSEEHFSSDLQVDTAGKIMALLSEIGTSSLVEPQCSENFHPCPWCSGRLITV